jgi:riboflavin transporter FmnP
MGSLLNAYVLLPFYAMAFQMNVSDLVAMGNAINPNITSLSQFIFYAVVPFNLLKGFIESMVVILIYKRVSFLIKGRFDDTDDLQV